MKILLMATVSSQWVTAIEWMKSDGHSIIKCLSCAQGLEALKNDPQIDIVMLDSSLADENGKKMLGLLKQDDRFSNIPIFIAGHNFDENAIRQLATIHVDDIILLPTTRETLEAKIDHALQMKGKTILIIDDQPEIIEVVNSFLEYEKCCTCPASNAEDGLAMLKSKHIDAVITDVIMPGMSGLELLVEVKKSMPWIPVIMISGHTGNCKPEEVIAMGAAGYLAKPFHNTELVETLRRSLRLYASKKPDAQNNVESLA